MLVAGTSDGAEDKIERVINVAGCALVDKPALRLLKPASTRRLERLDADFD